MNHRKGVNKGTKREADDNDQDNHIKRESSRFQYRTSISFLQVPETSGTFTKNNGSYRSWAVIQNEKRLSNHSNDRMKRETRLCDLSKVKDFSFLPSLQWMNIRRKNVESLCLCINDNHKSFDQNTHTLGDRMQFITQFMKNMFGSIRVMIGKKRITTFRVEIRKASWLFVDAAMKVIIEQCKSAVKRFEIMLFEPQQGQYTGNKSEKSAWRWWARVNTTGNVMENVMTHLADADSVYIKMINVLRFEEKVLREFDRRFVCNVDQVDDRHFIYKFKRRKILVRKYQRQNESELSVISIDKPMYQYLHNTTMPSNVILRP